LALPGWMTNIQGQTFFTVPLNPAKRQPQLTSWCFPHMSWLQERTKKAHSSVHYRKCGKYSITKNVNILWYTQNRFIHISQLPVNTLCWDLFWQPQLIMMTVTGLFVVHGGGRNQPLRSFNRLIHSSKREFFIRTDITQYHIIPCNVKMLINVWWLIIWRILMQHFDEKSLIQCPQFWRTLSTHMDTAQYGHSHRSTSRLTSSIYLRHPGRGGKQLHICKLWYVHHTGVINWQL
jgi:hypothetical protein